MLLKLKKEKVCVNKIIGQKVENIVVEGDIIVPDIKPDILNKYWLTSTRAWQS